jgi:hypothetical protein
VTGVPFRSIASTLIPRIIGAALAVAVVAATIQAFLTFRDERAAFDRALANIAETNVPLLSIALWDIEPQVVTRQLMQIAAQPEIAYVRLAERTGHAFEAGSGARARASHPRSSRFPIPTRGPAASAASR